MNVLHAAETVKGGVATVLKQLSPLSGKGGLVFHLLSPKEQSEEVVGCSFEQFHYFYRSGRNLKSLLSFLFSFTQALIKLKPEIVHLHSSFAGFLGRVVLIFLYPIYRPRVVYTPHGWAFIMGGGELKVWVYAFIEKLLLVITDKVICVSQYEKDLALKVGLSGKKIEVIYNGVQCDCGGIVQVKEKSKPFPDDKFNLLFVGRFDAQKGYDVALEVIKNLPESEYHLTIIGDAVLDGAIDRVVADNITYTGWLTSDSLSKYYRSADVLLMPSRWEAFGLVAVEAQCHSLPVLASNCCSLPEVIAHGYAGYLFDVGDVEKIVDLIVNTNRSVWSDFKSNARHNYLNKFTADRMRLSTYHLYFSLA